MSYYIHNFIQDMSNQNTTERIVSIRNSKCWLLTLMVTKSRAKPNGILPAHQHEKNTENVIYTNRSIRSGFRKYIKVQR